MQPHSIYIAKIVPAISLSVTIFSGILATLPPTSADSISPVDDTISITVDSSCTMGQTVLSNNTNLNPGETSTIGSSRISAYCNDSDGYAIYAIGYTDGEYGNTNMLSTDGSHTIPTGTSSTLGTNSYWNLRLTPSSSGIFIPTIENNFTTNTSVPSDYTKVASYPSTTLPQTSDPLASGSYFTTTYQAHISTTQPAGVYTGQVQYVMVHPTGAPGPTVPYMQNISQWKNKLIPNIGDTVQAIDKRDGKKYWITKLADGNIWMTQNLDLDIDANRTYTSADTDLPTGANWKPSTSTHIDKSWNRVSYLTPESYDPGNLYWNGEFIYGNLNNATVSDPSATQGGTHYHIGNYYNWTAAVAMNNSSSYTGETDINQSICPAGWRLPAYSGNKSYQNLVNRQGFIAGTNGNIHIGPAYFVYGGEWSGNQENYGESINVGNIGYYWLGRPQSSGVAYNLSFYMEGTIEPQLYYNGWRNNGYSVRCVAR